MPVLRNIGPESRSLINKESLRKGPMNFKVVTGSNTKRNSSLQETAAKKRRSPNHHHHHRHELVPAPVSPFTQKKKVSDIQKPLQNIETMPVSAGSDDAIQADPIEAARSKSPVVQSATASGRESSRLTPRDTSRNMRRSRNKNKNQTSVPELKNYSQRRDDSISIDRWNE